MTQFRTKKKGPHKGDVFPIEPQKGIPKGKPALKRNAIELHVKNEKPLNVEVPKKSVGALNPPSHTPTVQNVTKPPVKESGQ